MIVPVVDHTRTVKSTRHKTVRVVASQNNSYRTFEVQMPLDVDPDTFIAALDLQPYWASGQEISEGGFIAARERGNKEYYFMILMAAYKTAITSGDLDMARAAAFTAISANQDKLTEFLKLRSTVGLGNLETVADKRDDLLWMGIFAVVGIVSGG